MVNDIWKQGAPDFCMGDVVYLKAQDQNDKNVFPGVHSEKIMKYIKRQKYVK